LLPAYAIAEAAHYLSIPRPTVRSWVAGRPYPTKAGKQFFQPVVIVPALNPPVFSLLNFVDVHVLNAIRR